MLTIIYYISHFIWRPDSGINVSITVASSLSSSFEIYPYVLISLRILEWLVLRWVKNLASNLGISEVNILSKYPLTPA